MIGAAVPTSSWNDAPLLSIVIVSLDQTGPQIASLLPNTIVPPLAWFSEFVQYAYFAKLSCVSSRRRTKPVRFLSRASATMLAKRPNWPLVEPVGPANRLTTTPGTVELSAVFIAVFDSSCTYDVLGNAAGLKFSAALPICSAASEAYLRSSSFSYVFASNDAFAVR